MNPFREVLHDYIDNFFGYGSVKSRYWFIGLEEGGADDERTLLRRLTLWDQCGRKPIVDARAILPFLGGTNWFAEKPPLQRTWRPLMRLRYAAEGSGTVSPAELKRYQHDVLGSANGDTALLEVLPLPLLSRDDSRTWPYRELGIPEIADRHRYERTYAETRRQQLVKLIQEHAPPVVVTHGEAQEWRRLFGAHDVLNEKAWTARLGNSLIVITHHPEGARSNRHWEELGAFIRRYLG